MFLQELFVPTSFSVGDKFAFENNGHRFTVEVISMRGPEEIKIRTIDDIDKKPRESFTDALELASRLRFSKTWKRA